MTYITGVESTIDPFFNWSNGIYYQIKMFFLAQGVPKKTWKVWTIFTTK